MQNERDRDRSVSKMEAPRKSLRGLASADPETRRQVARKGGQAVSQNREHMAEIGRKGGEAVSRDRQHMAEIGRRGGEVSQSLRGPKKSQFSEEWSPAQSEEETTSETHSGSAA